MRHFSKKWLLVLLLLGLGWGCTPSRVASPQVIPAPQTLQPPLAAKIPKELTSHGHTRIDDYYWLNQRENPKVVAYLTAENTYLKNSLKHTEPLQEKLYQEIVGHIQQAYTTVPYSVNGYLYYARFQKDSEYPVYCRTQATTDAAEEVLLDVNQMSRGHQFFRVSEEFSVSPDNRTLAYGVDTLSRRLYTLYFKDLSNGTLYQETIRGTSGAPIWANDSQTVFYVTKDPQNLRECKVFRHRLGTPANQDQEVYFETDETFSLQLKKSKSTAYIFISSFSTLASEWRYIVATQPESAFQVILPRQNQHEYQVEHLKDFWIIRTNRQAENFKLVRAPITGPEPEHWQEIVPHRSEVFLQSYEVFADFVVLQEQQQGLPCLRALRWDTGVARPIPFVDPTYALSIASNQEFNTDLFRYHFTSLARPQSTFQFNMNTGETLLLKQEEVGGGFAVENYQTERLWASATDGTAIPISLVYRKGLKKDGTNPMLLTGYGSYGYSYEASFAVERLALLDRGFVFAIAHIRGGQEMGRYWYENGKLLKKKNTFTDFLDCALYLIDQQYTSKDRLFVNGLSAGGLLMGAVLNMNPELFKGVIAEVPFVDVVTTMLDKDIPLTTSEWDEWGNPEQKEYYDYMLSYSPYDRVEAKNYPALMVTAGLHDSQVQYWEPAKWVAKLRAIKTDRNPLYLYTNMSGGHDGASGRFQSYRDTAMIYAFILDLLGPSTR